MRGPRTWASSWFAATMTKRAKAAFPSPPVAARSRAGTPETTTPTKGMRLKTPAKNPRLAARGTPTSQKPSPTRNPTQRATKSCPRT